MKDFFIIFYNYENVKKLFYFYFHKSKKNINLYKYIILNKE